MKADAPTELCKPVISLKSVHSQFSSSSPVVTVATQLDVDSHVAWQPETDVDCTVWRTVPTRLALSIEFGLVTASSNVSGPVKLSWNPFAWSNVAANFSEKFYVVTLDYIYTLSGICS